MSKKKIVIIEIIAVVIAAVAAVVALESSAGTFSKEEQLGDNQQVCMAISAPLKEMR